MKIYCNEFDNHFAFDLQPETLEEAALLVRLKLNARPSTGDIITRADRTGVVSSIWFDKFKDERTHLHRA